MDYQPKPRFSTVGSQERLEALGFTPLVPGIRKDYAADALRRVQDPSAPAMTILQSYYKKEPSGEITAASIILQDGRVSIVWLNLTGYDPRNPRLTPPFQISEHDFMNGAALTGRPVTPAIGPEFIMEKYRDRKPLGLSPN